MAEPVPLRVRVRRPRIGIPYGSWTITQPLWVSQIAATNDRPLRASRAAYLASPPQPLTLRHGMIRTGRPQSGVFVLAPYARALWLSAKHLAVPDSPILLSNYGPFSRSLRDWLFRLLAAGWPDAWGFPPEKSARVRAGAPRRPPPARVRRCDPTATERPEEEVESPKTHGLGIPRGRLRRSSLRFPGWLRVC